MALNIQEKDGKKYIDDEEILCEYELGINIYKIIIFIFGLFIFFFYAKSKDYDVGISYMIFLVLLLIFFGVIILRNIQNVYKNRIYVTQNYIINASGKSFKTDNIHFTYVNVVTGFLSQNELFFYNGNKFNFIFFVEVNEDNENFKKLIQTLYDISNNENILVENMNFSKSRQKLIKGEWDGRES